MCKVAFASRRWLCFLPFSQSTGRHIFRLFFSSIPFVLASIDFTWSYLCIPHSIISIGNDPWRISVMIDLHFCHLAYGLVYVASIGSCWM